VRVLLDENLPRKLKRLASDLDVSTVQELGWAGTRNGRLLSLAEKQFDAFVTTDQGIPHQQNLASFRIGVILLLAKSNRFVDLAPLIPQIVQAIRETSPGELRRITRLDDADSEAGSG
jgi:hypothetical protein